MARGLLPSGEFPQAIFPLVFSIERARAGFARS
jgi:hypothetical protein